MSSEGGMLGREKLKSETLHANEHNVRSFKDVSWIRLLAVGFPDKKLEAAFVEDRVDVVSTIWLLVSVLFAIGDTGVLIVRYLAGHGIWWAHALDAVLCLQMVGSCIAFGPLRSWVVPFFTRHTNLLALLMIWGISSHILRICLMGTLEETNFDVHCGAYLWILCGGTIVCNVRIFILRHASFMVAIVTGATIYILRIQDENIGRCGSHKLAIALVLNLWALVSNSLHERSERFTFLVQLHLREARQVAEDQKANTLTTLAKMSHEIRTPVGCLLGLYDLLMNSTSEEGRAGFAKTIRAQGTHLLQLLNNILDHSKLRVGAVKLNETWNDPTFTLTNCVNAFQSEVAKKNITLKVNIDDSFTRQLKFDPTRLQQICTNFMSNAIKFTPEGGCITFEATCGVDIAHPHGRILELRVTDTGVGMEADQMDRLFDDFYQVESTRSRSAQGAGLGLSIARDLANTMGGKVGVGSVVNEGSTFWFKCLFQACENDLHRPDPTSSASVPSGEMTCVAIPSRSGVTNPVLSVLLVDDTPLNIRIYSSCLKRWGWSVTAASNGAGAIDKMKEPCCNMDAIIMDLHMPGMDGLETSRIITELYPSFPIFGLTADTTIDENEQLFKASGMRGLFYKPLSWEHTEKMRGVIASHGSAQTLWKGKERKGKEFDSILISSG